MRTVQKGWLVAPGPASTDLAMSMAKRLEAEVVKVDAKLFPDGESYFRIGSEVRNRRVLMVQSTYPPTDRHLLQALFLSHKLTEEGAEVYAVMPYLAYARQHRAFLKGEVVSLGVVGHLLRFSGVKRLVTVDIHNVEGLGLFPIPAYSTSAMPEMAGYIKRTYQLRRAMAISPDFGGSTRTEAFAKVLGIEYAALPKRRDRLTGVVKLEGVREQIQGKDVVIVDDIIGTGRTVELATRALKEAGAEKVIIACVHPLLLGDALERVRRAGADEIVGTNTVPSPISKVDVAPLLVSYIATL